MKWWHKVAYDEAKGHSSHGRMVDDGRINYNLNQILHLFSISLMIFCNYWFPFLLHLSTTTTLFFNSFLTQLSWISFDSPPHKCTIFKFSLGQRESIPNPSSQANSSTNIYSLFPLSLWFGFSGLERETL